MLLISCNAQDSPPPIQNYLAMLSLVLRSRNRNRLLTIDSELLDGRKCVFTSVSSLGLVTVHSQ